MAKRKTSLLIAAGLISLFLGSYADGKAEEKKSQWVHYGATPEGQFYYEKGSVQKVGGKIVRVWDQLTFKNNKISPSGKEANKGPGIQISLHEIDCENNKRKLIKYILYNREGKISENYINQNPKMRPIPPNTIYETLEKQVCR